ncbi:amylo-alpha-1,6-glucosidase domain protein [Mycobacterium xenopi 3993]|nr:amylo-alpha-1,6-glucosidase domain protein [Mycobacterium xenopi 3993]
MWSAGQYVAVLIGQAEGGALNQRYGVTTRADARWLADVEGSWDAHALTFSSGSR